MGERYLWMAVIEQSIADLFSAEYKIRDAAERWWHPACRPDRAVVCDRAGLDESQTTDIVDRLRAYAAGRDHKHASSLCCRVLHRLAGI